MSNERLIISNILYHNDKRHYLPRINMNWFEDSLCKKIVGVITQMYLNNEAIDYLTLIPHFERKELIDVITLQQNASDIDLRTHLLTLEYNYIKRNLVDRLTHLDLSNELPDMVKDIQSILEETTFSTHKEPESIVKVTNKVVDHIVDNSLNGGALTGKQTGWRYLDK